MRPQLKRSIVVVGIAVVIVTLWSGTRSAVVGQSPATYKAPRTADGQPDLNGFWQTLNTANWDLEEHGAQPAPFQNLVGAYLAQPAGFSVVEGGEIPYKPEALAKKKKYFENRLNPDALLLENGFQDFSDPEAKCFRGGVPRSTYLPYPFQIIQGQNKIFIGYEYNSPSDRVIYLGDDLDKTRATLADNDTWNGQSVGKWEGETLVVDVRWFSHDIWLDRAGNFYSPKAVVVERYTPTAPSHLQYEATITDPDTFTRPWKISMPLYRRIDPNMQLLEFQCIPFADEFVYGPLYKNPIKKQWPK